MVKGPLLQFNGYAFPTSVLHSFLQLRVKKIKNKKSVCGLLISTCMEITLQLSNYQ